MICGSFFIFDPFSNQCSVLAAEQVVCVIPFHSSNLIPPSFIFVDAVPSQRHHLHNIRKENVYEDFSFTV